jgi:hypothetical protein
MKPKFILTIVTLNTLFLGLSIATAPGVRAADNLPKLSKTISKLVNLDSKYYPLVTSAIDCRRQTKGQRAIASKRIVVAERENKEIKPPFPVHITAGAIAPETREQPQADRQLSEKDNKTIPPNTTTNNENSVDLK